jgi:hypothetical protein
MIISIDAGKATEKIQHLFMIKALKKLGIEGTYFNIMKSLYEEPIANIIPYGKHQKHFLKIRNETRVPILSTVIQYNT